jgi:hypothetical protein
VQDAGGLSDLAQLTLTIDGRNDAPVALDDTASAVEAGGTANGTAGSDGTGNVLTNDTDPDRTARHARCRRCAPAPRRAAVLPALWAPHWLAPSAA